MTPGSLYCYSNMNTVEQSSATLPRPILSLDLGKRRIGLAVTDPLGITAQGLETLQRTNIREDLAALERIVQAYGVTTLLMGNPLHMTGREGRQAEYTKEFAGRLQEKTAVPVIFWDERLTSVQANRVLRESGMSIEKRAAAVDRLAAVILLQSYLEHLAVAPSLPEIGE